ncbi:hypothetical protein CKO24_05760 [Rhodothalassium salexigens DSM 2132]|nr:hypothetical protein [Rhodothalassium salexigens DSM 2132]
MAETGGATPGPQPRPCGRQSRGRGARRWAAVALAAGLLAGCVGVEFPGGSAPVGPVPAPDTRGTGNQKVGRPYQIGGVWYYPRVDPGYDAVGLASWYGPKFHGRSTANGERFDMNKLTAAHRTLPMPSIVLVTNLENGRSVRLRVNDRGPFVDDRIIDVSRRAAQFLGFEQKGTARVRVQVLDANGQPADSRRVADAVPAPAGVGGPFFVQIASMSSLDNARRLRDAVARFGRAHIQKVWLDGRRFYRVRLGPYDGRSLAARTLDRLYDQGYYSARVFTDSIG